MPMPGDFPSASRWGYLITDDKKAKPLLKNLYKAIVNHIVSLEFCFSHRARLGHLAAE